MNTEAIATLYGIWFAGVALTIPAIVLVTIAIEKVAKWIS